MSRKNSKPPKGTAKQAVDLTVELSVDGVTLTQYYAKVAEVVGLTERFRKLIDYMQEGLIGELTAATEQMIFLGSKRKSLERAAEVLRSVDVPSRKG